VCGIALGFEFTGNETKDLATAQSLSPYGELAFYHEMRPYIPLNPTLEEMDQLALEMESRRSKKKALKKAQKKRKGEHSSSSSSFSAEDQAQAQAHVQDEEEKKDGEEDPTQAISEEEERRLERKRRKQEEKEAAKAAKESRAASVALSWEQKQALLDVENSVEQKKVSARVYGSMFFF